MFGADLGTRPGTVFDEDALLKLAEIRVAQRQLAAQGPSIALPGLPTDYATMTPQQQMRADLERRATAIRAQRAAITAPTEIVEAEIVDE